MIRLEEKEFQKIVSYVKTCYGVNLEKKKVLIECRLKNELTRHGLNSFSEYLNLVQEDESGMLAEEMIDRLTTHYTYFMRESSHFEFIRDNILPEVSSRKNSREYRIWCAGCSSGQECYTLAMLLENYQEKGCHFPPYKILATDISNAALKQAMAGKYPQKELEGIPQAWIDRYCRICENQTFEIDSNLKKNIIFRKQNLITQQYGKEQFDLILCRNVMIYFSPEAKEGLIHKMENSLKTGGYFFIGHAELLHRNSISLQPVGSAVYKKIVQKHIEKAEIFTPGGFYGK